MASKKYTAFCIYQILKEHSDEDHALSQKEIIEFLKNDYQIKIERKSIGSIINEMRNDEVFSDFDIQKPSKRGAFLGQRIIEKEEMRYLTDALFSSRTLTGRQAKEIINKIGKEFSKYERNSFEYVVKSEDVNRTRNKNVLVVIDRISEAIEKKKKIKFKYNKNLLSQDKEEKERIVSPYFLINNQGGYYLISYSDKHPEDLTHYRVDKIENIEILEDRASPITKIKKYDKGIDRVKYANARPYMFSGDEVTAKIKLLKNDSLGNVIDWFGPVKQFLEKDNYYVKLEKVNENALIYWSLQYCDYVELVSPSETRNKIKEKLKQSFNRYK